jgi:hypothetical protein
MLDVGRSMFDVQWVYWIHSVQTQSVGRFLHSNPGILDPLDPLLFPWNPYFITNPPCYKARISTLAFYFPEFFSIFKYFFSLISLFSLANWITTGQMISFLLIFSIPYR